MAATASALAVATRVRSTRDLAAAKSRWEEFAFDQALYVVGNEQSLHFQQFTAVLKRCGAAWAERLGDDRLGDRRNLPAGPGVSTAMSVLAALQIEPPGGWTEALSSSPLLALATLFRLDLQALVLHAVRPGLHGGVAAALRHLPPHHKLSPA